MLVVQDTTTLNFTALQHIIPELGPIDSGGLARGVHLHTGLALTTSGQIIGILDQQYWRGPSRASRVPRRKRAASGSTASMHPAPFCTRQPAIGRSPG